MAVPYTFAAATGSLPLSQLDSNFATTITIGNTAVQLGNTVTTLNNMTMANVTVSTVTASDGSANCIPYLTAGKAFAYSSALSFDGSSLTVNNIIVGRGGGNIFTNTLTGYASLTNNTSGIYNACFGYQSLLTNTTGSNNAAFGGQSLAFASTDSNNSAFGYQALYSVTGVSNSTGLGSKTSVTGSNQVQLGDSATTTYAYGTVQNRSDARDKADVRDTVLGLSFIKELRPVDYKWDYREDYKPPMPENEDDIPAWIEACKLKNLVHDGSKKRSRYHHGLIAQEVEAVIAKTGVDFGGFQNHSVKGGDDVMSIGYNELIAPLIKAVQELAAKVEAQEVEIAALKGAN